MSTKLPNWQKEQTKKNPQNVEFGSSSIDSIGLKWIGVATLIIGTITEASTRATMLVLLRCASLRYISASNRWARR